MTENAISVRNLSFYYAQQQSLFNVSFDFKRHQNTCIIGSSGSGKSTLLRVLNKIYAIYPAHQATGEVVIDGENILEPAVDLRSLRTKVGMVFQKPTPFPMSIYQNIAFALKTHYRLTKSECDACVEQALRQATLWDEVKDTLHKAGTHLSGGQQQRLCFARTLAIRPEVLVLDEPTSALDPICTHEIENLIAQLKEHYTIIMVTHKLKQARDLADHVLFMSKGRVVEHNNCADFFERPQEKETQIYIANE